MTDDKEAARLVEQTEVLQVWEILNGGRVEKIDGNLIYISWPQPKEKS
jgi:hypothetical protein